MVLETLASSQDSRLSLYYRHAFVVLYRKNLPFDSLLSCTQHRTAVSPASLSVVHLSARVNFLKIEDAILLLNAITHIIKDGVSNSSDKIVPWQLRLHSPKDLCSTTKCQQLTALFVTQVGKNSYAEKVCQTQTFFQLAAQKRMYIKPVVCSTGTAPFLLGSARTMHKFPHRKEPAAFSLSILPLKTDEIKW